MNASDPHTGVIVIGNHLQALGIIRSLGRRGIPVTFVNDKKVCLGRFSRYTRNFLVCPPLDDYEKLADFLIGLAKNDGARRRLLLPTSDAAVCALSTCRTRLEPHYLVATPPWDIVQNAINKKLTYAVAKKCGIPCPETWFPEDLSDVQDIGRSISYSVILKPAVMHSFYKIFKKKAVVAQDRSGLTAAYEEITRSSPSADLMIQDIIPGRPGHLYSFCSFFKNGQVNEMCMGRRHRQRPMDFGKGTTFAESEFVPELAEYGPAFLKEINYYGLSEIEFKKDPRDNRYKMLEMNARTWLWHSLAARCGIDFPAIQYDDLVNGGSTPPKTFRTQVKWMHFTTDFATSFQEILAGRLKPSEDLESFRGERESAVFARDDPAPFFAEALLLPYLLVTR